jgi:hypothetical protein
VHDLALDFVRRCAPGGFLLLDTSVRNEIFKDVLVEFLRECLKQVEIEIPRIHLVLDAVRDDLPDDTVCLPEWHTLSYEIICQLGGSQIIVSQFVLQPLTLQCCVDKNV